MDSGAPSFNADFATLYATGDLPELMAVAGAIGKGSKIWALLRPLDPKLQAILFGREHERMDSLAASQIARIHFPVGGGVFPATAPWAKVLLGLLQYQVDWTMETSALFAVWEGGTLIAVVGATDQAGRDEIPSSALVHSVGLAIRRLHQLAELRQEVEGAKSLLHHQAQSIVLARPGGKIMHGTEGGMAVLQRLRSLSSLPQDKQEAMLPSVLRNAIEREARHIVVADLRVRFCELAMTEVTTATELISIQFSRELKKQPQAKASVSLGDLTPAEQRVLPLLMEGLRNKEIADRLNSSIHTIKHHVSSILAKARCSDRLLLVAKASQPMEDPNVKKLVVAPLPEGDFLPPSMTEAKATKSA